MAQPEGPVTPCTDADGRSESRSIARCATALLSLLLVLHVSPARSDAQAPSRAGAATLAVVGGYLIDGHGGPPVENSVILVEGDRITHVGTVADTEVPDGAEVVDADGRTVMPGLLDAHVHLLLIGHGVYSEYFQRYRHEQNRMREFMVLSAEQLLDAGVTTARDVGAELADAIWVRDAIERGEIPGPQLLVSGPFLQKSTGPTQAFVRWTVDGPEDARAKARRLVEAGVDQLKVVQLGALSEAERDAIAEVARTEDLPIVAHAWGEEEHRMAAAMGAASIEHLGAGPRHVDQFTDRSVRLLAESGVAVVPTMVVSMIYDITEAFPERLDEPRLRTELPEDVYRDVRSSLDEPSHLGYFAGKRRITPHYFEMVRRLRDGGVPLTIGTDSGTPMNFHYESTWQEMALFVEAGFDPMDVLQMATKYNAELFGVEDVGTIEPGKQADLLVIDGNPLVDMSALSGESIVHVISDGRLHR